MKKTDYLRSFTKATFVIILSLCMLLCNVTCTKASEIKSPTNSSNRFKVVFNITIPRALQPGESLSIGCDYNGWDPSNPNWFATKVDDTHYTYTTDLDDIYSDNETLSLMYKYTIQNGSNGKWDMVELNTEHNDIDDRVVVLKKGTNTFNDTVEYFMSSNEAASSKNTLSKSRKLDVLSLKMPQFDDDREKTVRVLLPSDYDKSKTDKKYPVIYLHDGQNLFDRRSCDYGEWGVDEALDSLVKNGYSDSIIVGIDSHKTDRMSELRPKLDKDDTDSYGTRYSKFIVETLKPYIDKNYNTLSSREYTVIGGSSMGGTMAFYMGLQYPDVFGYTMCLSTALWMFDEKDVNEYMDSLDMKSSKNLSKMYIYCGDGQKSDSCDYDNLEESFKPYVELMKNALVNHGYTDDMVTTSIGKGMGHNDFTWGLAFTNAYKWFNIKVDSNTTPAPTEISSNGNSNTTNNTTSNSTNSSTNNSLDKSPKTADNTMIIVAIIISLLALSVITVLILKRKKNIA